MNPEGPGTGSSHSCSAPEGPGRRHSFLVCFLSSLPVCDCLHQSSCVPPVVNCPGLPCVCVYKSPCSPLCLSSLCPVLLCCCILSLLSFRPLQASSFPLRVFSCFFCLRFFSIKRTLFVNTLLLGPTASPSLTKPTARKTIRVTGGGLLMGKIL